MTIEGDSCHDNKKMQRVIDFITLCEYEWFREIKTLDNRKICKAKILF